MKAVAICGSPRKEGNTETLLNKCLEKLSAAGIDSKLLSLRGKTITPCIACGVCRKKQDKTCAIKNDDFHPIFEEMLDADIIITGSPVYFGSATPETMALLDRAGYVSRSNDHLFTRKIGGPVVVARRAGQNFTYAQLMLWYTINDMIVVGSTYWNVAFGLQPGDSANDEEGVNTVERFAENLIWLSEKIK
jgi:multimeric flavodoxin WrbA